MSKQEIEKRLLELKAEQAAHFQKKKADRDSAALEAVRKEMNELKGQVKALYRPGKAEKAEAEA